MKKQGNPRPCHPHWKHPLPFFLSSTLSLSAIAVGHPRANITLHQLGYFHFAHSAAPCCNSVQSGEPKAYFLSLFMFDSNIFIREFRNRVVSFTKIKTNITIIVDIFIYLFILLLNNRINFVLNTFSIIENIILQKLKSCILCILRVVVFYFIPSIHFYYR